MKTLHLNLKRKWFDMIKSGEKKEEYRDIKKFWANRFCGSLTYEGENKGLLPNEDNTYFSGFYPYTFENYDTITFSNGYAKDRDQFVIELKSIKISSGNPEWGAEQGKKYFVLELGKIIE